MSSDNRSTEESPVFPFNLCFAEHNLAQTSSFFSRSMRLKIIVVWASPLSFSNKEKKQIEKIRVKCSYLLLCSKFTLTKATVATKDKFEAVTSLPQATPRAFKLLKIGLLKFLPTMGQNCIQMPQSSTIFFKQFSVWSTNVVKSKVTHSTGSNSPPPPPHPCKVQIPHS